MNKNEIIITTLHQVSGDTTPPSLTNSFISQYQDEPIKEKYSLEKTFEAFLESIRQVKIQLNSMLLNNFQIQDPYSNFQVQPQQEEPLDIEKNIKFMIQSQMIVFNPKWIVSNLSIG